MNVIIINFFLGSNCSEKTWRERGGYWFLCLPQNRASRVTLKFVFFWKYRVLREPGRVGRLKFAFISFSKVVLPWTWFNGEGGNSELNCCWVNGESFAGWAAHWGLLTDNQSPVGPACSGQSPVTSGCFQGREAAGWLPGLSLCPCHHHFTLPSALPMMMQPGCESLSRSVRREDPEFLFERPEEAPWGCCRWVFRGSCEKAGRGWPLTHSCGSSPAGHAPAGTFPVWYKVNPGCA